MSFQFFKIRNESEEMIWLVLEDDTLIMDISTDLKYDMSSLTGIGSNSHFADCKQRVTQYVVPFVTHTRTKETKPAVVGQVQGYVISFIIFCDKEVTLPYCFLRYHSLVPINQQDLQEQLL